MIRTVVVRPGCPPGASVASVLRARNRSRIVPVLQRAVLRRLALRPPTGARSRCCARDPQHRLHHCTETAGEAMNCVSEKLAEALALAAAKEYAAAEDVYAAAVALAEENFGEHSEVTASCLCHLGRACAQGGKVEVAVAFLDKAVTIREGLLGGGARGALGADGATIPTGAFAVAANLMELADGYRALGRQQDATEAKVRADRIVARAGGPGRFGAAMAAESKGGPS